MEYERIHKVEGGITSPSKLRMKVMTVRHQRIIKDGCSRSTSSRASPSKLQQDSEYLEDNLLHFQIQNHDEEVPTLKASSVKLRDQSTSSSLQGMVVDGVAAHDKVHDGISFSSVHSIKAQEAENLDNDSNASSSSFEFHNGGDRGTNRCLTRSFSRPTPYKWYEAEKWIMNKQSVQANSHSKGHGQLNNRFSMINMVRVTPESTAGFNHRLPTKTEDTRRVDLILSHGNVANTPIDLYPAESKDLKEIGPVDSVLDDASGISGIPAIRAVCMRDMGTEMTPVTSQEPSRTATPVGATTPLRSPSSSIPSTPRRGPQLSSPIDHVTHFDSHNPTEDDEKELSEQELKLKTRREIVALGVQLGKMNIAAWASKHENEMSETAAETTEVEELERIEFEKRAAAWEEAEKSKHTARFKREEIKIQAWESRQKAKLQSQMKRTEAKVEQMRAAAEGKMVKKILITRKKSEERRAAAEARKNRQAEKAAAQVEYIRQTGGIPSSNYICCGLFL